MDYHIVWRGPVFDATGYGTASREYVLELYKQGVDVKIETWSWGFPLKEKGTKRIGQLSRLVEKPYATNKQKILIYHSPPWNIDLNRERKNFDWIVLNTVWETSKLPRDWIPAINEYDAVCVPSLHNMEVMTNSGVKVPVFHVPHGVDTKRFDGNKKYTFEQTEGKFIFVSVFEFQHRKNPETLLRAYWEEFTSKDNVALVIKTHWGKRSRQLIIDRVLEYKKSLELSHKTAPVFVITKLLKDEELRGIYRLGNAFVLATRGEGVGLPFMEALSTGIPVIATGWGGQMDFLHENNAFLVEFNLANPKISMESDFAISPAYRQLFAEEGQLWAEADINDLRRMMREGYQNPDLCKQKGQQGYQDMLRWSWTKAVTLLRQAIETVIQT